VKHPPLLSESSLIGVVGVKLLFSFTGPVGDFWSITPVATRQLNVSKESQIEIDDGFESFGCRAFSQAIWECSEPVRIFGLYSKQYVDCITPASMAASSVGRPTKRGDDRRRFGLMARAITGLALGVAQRVLTCRFAASRHEYVLRYSNVLPWDRHHPGSPCRTPFLPRTPATCRVVPRSLCRARGSLASLRGRRGAAA